MVTITEISEIPEVPVNGSFFNDVKSFVKSHKALCMLTLGIAVVGYSLGKLGGRAISWIGECFGTAKKTGDVAKERLSQERPQGKTSPIKLFRSSRITPNAVNLKTSEIARLPVSDNPHDSRIVYWNEDKIKERGGIPLTKNYEVESKNFDYVGIVALPNKDGGYCLHLCPGGGNLEFKRIQIDQYMSEAIDNLVGFDITITAIAGNVGRHPGGTIDHFKAWQADNFWI